MRISLCIAILLATAGYAAARGLPLRHTFEQGAAGDGFGNVTAFVGDVNGDGVPDIAIGERDLGNGAETTNGGSVRFGFTPVRTLLFCTTFPPPLPPNPSLGISRVLATSTMTALTTSRFRRRGL